MDMSQRTKSELTGRADDSSGSLVVMVVGVGLPWGVTAEEVEDEEKESCQRGSDEDDDNGPPVVVVVVLKMDGFTNRVPSKVVELAKIRSARAKGLNRPVRDSDEAPVSVVKREA